MGKRDSMLIPVSRGLEEMEGARSAMVIYPTGQSRGLSDLSVVTDPELPEKAIRWRFAAEYKRRILRETESCKELGQTDVLLRREDFYSSNLVTWRRHPERGTLKSLSMNNPAASSGVSPEGIVLFAASGGEFDPERLKKRGPDEKKPNPPISRIAKLEKQKLGHKIQQAESSIAAKKAAEIFQRRLDSKGVTNS
jgi:hypothetical protein